MKKLLQQAMCIVLFSVAFKGFTQDSKRAHFFGINPSVTIEPFYEEGELDLNILPIVYQIPIMHRLDFRFTTLLNYGIRNDGNTISHVGLEWAAPIFFGKKEDMTELSKGFYAAPIISVSQNKADNVNNVGVWLELGYNLLFENRFAMTFGIQVGGTYFLHPNKVSSWGSHFGVKIIFGRWF